jgi:hypothetical protein
LTLECDGEEGESSPEGDNDETEVEARGYALGDALKEHYYGDFGKGHAEDGEEVGDVD